MNNAESRLKMIAERRRQGRKMLDSANSQLQEALLAGRDAGLTVKQMAKILGTSSKTVHTHLRGRRYGK